MEGKKLGGRAASLRLLESVVGGVWDYAEGTGFYIGNVGHSRNVLVYQDSKDWRADWIGGGHLGSAASMPVLASHLKFRLERLEKRRPVRLLERCQRA